MFSGVDMFPSGNLHSFPEIMDCSDHAHFGSIRTSLGLQPCLTDFSIKFVLQVYCDWCTTGDRYFLDRAWLNCLKVLERTCDWIEFSEKLAECSEDNYRFSTCGLNGSPWAACCFSMKEMAKRMNDKGSEVKYEGLFLSAKQFLEERLWTGCYFKTDTSYSWSGNSVRPDQLIGIWHLRASGVNHEMLKGVRQALETIFNLNVNVSGDGAIEFIRNVYPDGSIDTIQEDGGVVKAADVYALAALMIHEGMIEEGFGVAESAHRKLSERSDNQLQMSKFPICGVRGSTTDIRTLNIWTIKKAMDRHLKRHF